jgi:hypothetical protein
MRTRTRLALSLSVLTLASLVACDKYLTVDNLTTLDVNAVDPVRDAQTLSKSSLEDFASVYDDLVMYMGWFTGDILPTDTFADPNDFSRRDIPPGGAVSTMYNGLERAMVSAKSAISALNSTPAGTKSADLARVEMVAGYSFELLAEEFCQATVAGGAPLAPAALIDSAIAHFSNAITVGTAAGTTGATFVNASYVGRARAELQKGDKANAAADAAKVPAGFTYNMTYSDDLANRTRLGNTIWDREGGSRGSITVAPAYRGLSDPRVPVLAPGQHSLLPQDGVTPYFVQQKYTAYSSPIRLASRVEADYIGAEASGTAAELALIATRRTASAQPAYAGATDAASVLVELENQRARDFYLEGKRLGDLQRNGAAVTNMPVPGSTYFKNGYDKVQALTCYPMPSAEVNNNPNIPH